MMSASFNPYHKWLAIPPEDQPANHYRLLAIELWEDDAEVIANAAEQRISHLRILEMGEQGETASELIAEITAARDCLLDSAARAAYEDQLRGTQESEPEEAGPVLTGAIATESVGSRAKSGDAKPRERTSTRKKGKQNTKKAKKVRLLGHILAPIIGLALGGVILWVIKSMPSAEERENQNVEIPDWGIEEEAAQGQQSSNQSDGSVPTTAPTLPNEVEGEGESGQFETLDQQGADTTEPTAEVADQKESAGVSVSESLPTEDSAAIAEEDGGIAEEEIAEEDIATETASDDPAVDFPDPVDTGAELSPGPSPPAEEESPGFDAAIAELEGGLEEAIAEGALLRQLELVERLTELTGDDGWGQQLELFDAYQQRDQRDETLIARAALLLSDRAALEGRIEEAQALAADGLRAARRQRNPRLERMVTMRILELPLGESE